MNQVQDAVDIKDPLAEHLEKKIRLYIFDKAILSQTGNFLRALRFGNVESTPVPLSYIISVQQLYVLLRKSDELVFVNPPLTIKNGTTIIKKDIIEFFAELKRFIGQKTNADSMEIMSRCVPIFPKASHLQMREKITLALSEFGITGAFILKEQESMLGLSATAQKAKKNELVAERFNEVRTYLIEYLTMDSDQAVRNLKAKLEEKELSEKKAESDKWIDKAEEFKLTKNYEEAINCYKKAIDVYPGDPDTYLESGRTYIRIQKYTRAMERFKQAIEVSEDLPTPNQEIGNLRIVQVKEKIAKGEDPNSPEITKLLEEAHGNFETAIGKASSLKPIGPDDKSERDKDATSRVAGDIFKANLSSIVGPKHKMAIKISALANDSIKEVSGESLEDLHPAQVVTLGLGALDRGDYEEAERLLFIAAKNKDYFHDAVLELNYFGTRIRREKGEDEAITIYNKILELNPPNKSAIHFNLAVAWVKKKHVLKSIGSIVKAVYLDPHLPNDATFYQSPEIFDILQKFITTLSVIDKAETTINIPAETAAYYEHIEKLEELIHTDRAGAMKYIYKLSGTAPLFFKNPVTYAHPHIINLMSETLTKFSTSQRADAQKLAKFLSAALNYGNKIEIPKLTRSSIALLSRTIEVLYKSADQAEAAYFLAQAIASNPQYLQKPDFYADPTILNLTKEIRTKLSNVKIEKLV